jgi:DNA invertase Pin-like site-specific DNA recombinase
MTEAPKPKAYSYLRFSTPEQAKGDSQRRQWELAQRYAEEHGLELDEELTFRDLGVSAFRGANAETGRLGDFLKAIDEGLVANGSFLLVESLDRISRSTARKALRVLEDIIDRGVTVVTLADRRVYNIANLDNDPTSLLMSILVFMRAHEESATKSRRLKAVYGNKRREAREGIEGKPFTRRLPAWIRWNEDAKALEPIPERAKVVRDIFDMAEAGFGKDAIARTLNDGKVPTFGNAEYWRRSYVDKILTNPAVAGTFVPKVKEFVEGKPVRKAEEPIKGYFPAVVNEEVFARQGLRPKAPKGRHAGKAVSSIFQGLGTCELCGSSFVRVSKGKYVYLVCSKAHAKGGCEYRSVPYAEAEKAIRQNIDAIVAQVPRGHSTAELEQAMVDLELEVDEVRWNLEGLLDDFSRTRSPAIRSRIEKLEQELNEKLEALRALRAQREELASGLILKRIEKLKSAFAARPFDKGAANKALAENIRELRFEPRHGLISIRWQNGEWAEESIPIPAIKFAKEAFRGGVND